MAKNGQKMAKNETKHFFWKMIFSYFFITYQGLTPCKKSKKSKERILRSGVRTNGLTDKGKSIVPTSKVGGSKNTNFWSLEPSLWPNLNRKLAGNEGNKQKSFKCEEKNCKKWPKMSKNGPKIA